MSEKDIRDTLEALTDDYMKDNYNDMILSAVYGVLDEEPDLVKVLRYVTPLWDAAWNSEKTCGMAIGDALLYVIEYITDELGVRLTEDGNWEYLEEE